MKLSTNTNEAKTTKINPLLGMLNSKKKPLAGANVALFGSRENLELLVTKKTIIYKLITIYLYKNRSPARSRVR